MTKKILIAESSGVFCALVEKILQSCDGFAPCGRASDVYQAAAMVQKHSPDLVILASRLGGMDTVKFLQQLIPQYPVPVIVCADNRSRASASLCAGAADYIVKPKSNTAYDLFKQQLIASIKNAANLRQVVCEGVVYPLRETPAQKRSDDRLILIGGSAGSTQALPIILSSFTPDMPSTAVTLHMPEGYTKMYAVTTNRSVPIRVAEAVDLMPLNVGTAVLAQGAKHMMLSRGEDGFCVNLGGSERVSGHCPSVDVLFHSAVSLNPKRTIAVLLTGMGTDGARGLLELRRAGAYTIGQDEKSSLVYGMPKAAYDMGAVCKQCALQDIASEIKLKLKEWGD